MKTKNAFTLIELLVVISIIAIFAGLAFPILLGKRNPVVTRQRYTELPQTYQNPNIPTRCSKDCNCGK